MTYGIVPETRGKTLEQIQERWSKARKSESKSDLVDV